MSADTYEVTEVDYPEGSSLVRVIAYDDKDGTLYVDLNGQVYAYSNVLKDVYDDFVQAPSVGHFYHENVRGKFPSEWLGLGDECEFEVRPVEPAVADATALGATVYDVEVKVTYTTTVQVGANSLTEAIENGLQYVENGLETDDFVIEPIAATRT